MAVLGYAVLGYTILGIDEDRSTGATTTTAPRAGSTGTWFQLGDPIHLLWEVTDEEWTKVDPTSWTLVVAHESGLFDDVTADVVHDETGVFSCSYLPAIPGRYVATFTAVGDYAGVGTVLFDVQAADLAFVSVAQLRDYLGATSATDDEITTALLAERAAQAQRCRINPYTHELREALMRRVARNLAARSVPVATWTSFEGGGTSTRVPAVDAEVRRLEGPYRRLTCG